MFSVSPQLQATIQEVVESLGFTFWGVQWITQGPVLRVFIDAASGIQVDDCAIVSRQLSAVLDVEDPSDTRYTLEVSSPGLDRPIFTLEQFSAWCGSAMQIRLHVPINGRKKWQGRLTQVVAEQLTLQTAETLLTCQFQQIESARIIPDI
jgi:ribosome maturation factor RimP